MSTPTQTVWLVVLLSVVTGCYRTHFRGDDAGARDASPRAVDAARAPDARGDAGPPEHAACSPSRDSSDPRVVWATTLVRSFDDLGTAELPEIQALPGGGVVVATAAHGRAVIVRETNERGPDDFFCVVARFDAEGGLVWRREFERCDVIDLGVSPDESVCVLGRFSDGASFGHERLAGEGLYVLSLDAGGEPRFASAIVNSGGDALDVACDGRTVAVGAGREAAELVIDGRTVLGPPSGSLGFVATWEPDGALRWARDVEGVAAAIAMDETGDVWSVQHGIAGEGGGVPGRIEVLAAASGEGSFATSVLVRGGVLFFDEIEITPRGLWVTGRFLGELTLPGGVRTSVPGDVHAGFAARLARDGTGLGVATVQSRSSPLYVNLSAIGDEEAIVAGAFRGEGDFAGLSATATLGTDVFALAVRADGSAEWLRTFADEPSPRAAPYVASDERWRAPADVSARSEDEIYVAARFLSRMTLGDCVLTGEEMNSFLARLSRR